MQSRLSRYQFLRGSVLLCALLPTLGQAAEITHVSYTDSPTTMTWKFKWSGIVPAAIEPFGPPAASQGEWSAEGNLTDLADGDPFPDPDVIKDDLTLLVTHKIGPHGETDAPSISLFIQNIDQLANSDGFLVSIPGASVTSKGGEDHDNGHSDRYTFFYSTKGAPAAGRVVDFTIVGTHTVPEPATFGLLAMSLLALAGRRRQA